MLGARTPLYRAFPNPTRAQRTVPVQAMAAAVKVGIVGSGNVGSNLGGQLLRAEGFNVKYASKDPGSEKITKLLKEQPNASAGPVPEVVSWADVAILAVPGSVDDTGVKSLAASLSPGVNGKVVIDATNPLTGFPGLEVRWGQPTSAGEVLAAALPDTYVYKAFNTIGASLMDKPNGSSIAGEQLTLLFAGPKEKQELVASVISAVGFAPKYVGPIRYARNLEAIAELWIHLGVPPAGETKEDWGQDFHFQVIGH